MSKWIITLVLAGHLTTAALAADKPVPEENPGTPPDLATSQAQLICLDCKNHDFDTATHKEILTGLLPNAYNKELRRALFWQDRTI